MSRSDDSEAADREAIEALRRRDVAASRTGDFATLRTLIDDEAAILAPGAPVRRGRAAIDRSFEQMARGYAEIEVLEYEQRFEELVLRGDLAIEWGSLRGSSKRRGSDEIERATHHLMRVLRRQPDGGWKVWRTIWNDAGDGD